MDKQPWKIDPQLRARCVRLVRDHAQEYPTLTAATAAVARQEGVSRESVRRWLAQAEVDDGTRPGVTSDESAEVKRLKAENKRLREYRQGLLPAQQSRTCEPLRSVSRECNHPVRRRLVPT